MNNWQNFGDVNPIPHGGFWIKPEEGFPNQYRYVQLELVEYAPYQFEITSGLVDLSADWIDWEDVEATCDVADCPEWKVVDAVTYYGHANFGSYGPDWTIPADENSETAIAELLQHYGITLI